MTRSNDSTAAASSPRTGDFGAQITARLDELAGLTDEPGRLTRLYLSPAHRKAADVVLRWMREAGMEAHLDSIGNVVGRYESGPPGAPALLLGSHIDTVRDAGKFEGALGVLTPIAVVSRLNAVAKRFPFAIEIIAFGDEEGVRFPSTFGGPRALAGAFDFKALDEVDEAGKSRRQALIQFGCDPSKIHVDARTPERVLGYVEVHIEQGRTLEAEDLPLGVVTAINGASRGYVEIKGQSGHADTVPMRMRHDAMTAAAEMILAIEAIALSEPDLQATIGRVNVPNAAPNTIAGVAGFSLDIQSRSDEVRAAAALRIRETVVDISRDRGVETDVSVSFEAPAANCDPALSQALASAIARRGLAVRRMPSGARHNAMAFRARFPFAILFVRCRGGIAYNPSEHVGAEDIDLAARILEDFINEFAPKPNENP